MVFFIFYGQVIFHCMYIASSLSIILSVDPQVASISWLLWIVWLWTQACIFWIIVLSGFKSRSRTTGSYGSSIFSFLRTCSTVFHSGFTSLHPQQQRTLHGDMLLFLSSSSGSRAEPSGKGFVSAPRSAGCCCVSRNRWQLCDFASVSVGDPVWMPPITCMAMYGLCATRDLRAGGTAVMRSPQHLGNLPAIFQLSSNNHDRHLWSSWLHRTEIVLMHMRNDRMGTP